MNLRNKEFILKAGIITLLSVAVLAIYWQVGNYSFILFDDEDYVLLNSRLRIGFTSENIRWFLTSTHASNWHPITWFSHILDVKLFGLNAKGHHFTSVFLHGINAILLFLFLQRFTGSLWRSATVAALFAVHPLNVESVAWVSERKNVLSTLFWLLTLYFYASYTKQKCKLLYILAVFSFILGLMSKQMLVSVPFVLLLLDYWPLRRLSVHTGVKPPVYFRSLEFRSLLLEKMPFLILAVVASVIAVISQKQAMSSLVDSPAAERLANASISYTQYIRKIIWPSDFSVFYPLLPNSIHLWEALGSTALLIVITTGVVKLRTRYPVLLVGWFWYLISLIPVIGIVKIGLQSMADRYAYVPTIGIFIMGVWYLAKLAGDLPRRKLFLGCITCIYITILSVTAWHQASYWKDSTTLFSRALATTEQNYIALFAIGRVLEKQGKLDEALQKYDETLEMYPLYNYARIQQGIIFMNTGQLEAAALKFNKSILQNPKLVSAYINLGIIMAMQNRFNEAIHNFRIAIGLEPNSAAANYNLALTLQKLGKNDEAIFYYGKALATDPTDHDCHYSLGIVLENQERYEEAIQHFKEALRLKPELKDATSNLERIFLKQSEIKSPLQQNR